MAIKTVISKLAQKYQATIPEQVRMPLNLTAGDAVAFHIKGGEITLTKAQPVDLVFTHVLETTLGEWTSKEDNEAYADL